MSTAANISFEQKSIQKGSNLPMCGLVGTTSCAAGAFEQTWIGNAPRASKSGDGFVNRPKRGA
jgi:hypothetical protein